MMDREKEAKKCHKLRLGFGRGINELATFWPYLRYSRRVDAATTIKYTRIELESFISMSQISRFSPKFGCSIGSLLFGWATITISFACSAHNKCLKWQIPDFYSGFICVRLGVVSAISFSSSRRTVERLHSINWECIMIIIIKASTDWHWSLVVISAEPYDHLMMLIICI